MARSRRPSTQAAREADPEWQAAEAARIAADGGGARADRAGGGGRGDARRLRSATRRAVVARAPPGVCVAAGGLRAEAVEQARHGAPKRRLGARRQGTSCGPQGQKAVEGAGLARARRRRASQETAGRASCALGAGELAAEGLSAAAAGRSWRLIPARIPRS